MEINIKRIELLNDELLEYMQILKILKNIKYFKFLLHL